MSAVTAPSATDEYIDNANPTTISASQSMKTFPMSKVHLVGNLGNERPNSSIKSPQNLKVNKPTMLLRPSTASRSTASNVLTNMQHSDNQHHMSQEALCLSQSGKSSNLSRALRMEQRVA